MIAYRATLVDRELVQFVAKLLATERHWRKTPKGSRALTCFWQAVLGLRWFRDRTTPEALARPRRERAGCHAPGRAPAVDLARRAWVGARHRRRPHPRPARPLPRRRSRRRPRIRGPCDAWAGLRSIDRLVDWCAEQPVAYLLGCHIEMTTKPGVDYPVGWSHQPDETPLQLTTDHLKQIQSTLKAHNHQPDRYVLPQMIITPVG